MELSGGFHIYTIGKLLHDFTVAIPPIRQSLTRTRACAREGITITSTGNQNMNTDDKHLEIQRVRNLLTDEIERLEIQGGDVRSFSSALLLAASELYSEVYGSNQLRLAFARLVEVEAVHKTAGRA